MATTTPDARSPASTSTPSGRIAVHRHHAANRWMHWINLPVMTVMVWSGLRIYWANDDYAIGVGSWEWLKLFPEGWYQALDLDQHLARGIAFHLTFAWLFVLNGTAYVTYLVVSGGWRRIVPSRGDLRALVPTFLHELGVRSRPVPPGRYNAVQKLTYTVVIAMGAVLVATGFAIYKPASLNWLTALFGGYEVARWIHFSTSMAFIGFVVVHVVQVIRAGWADFAAMITGYRLRPRREGTTDG